jgi:Cytochrome P460
MRFIVISSVAIAGLLALVSFTADGQTNAEPNDPGARAVVDKNGNMRVPAGYRTSYQFLGSWAVADKTGESPTQLHIVYASPGTIAAYRKDRRFPDGSVLVKEIFETATGPMKTGSVSRAETLKGWFVMVKDSKNRHPDSPLWGDGWGWSWFDAGRPLKTTSTNFEVNCKPCHVPARATDWIYVQGYPPLEQAH